MTFVERYNGARAGLLAHILDFRIAHPRSRNVGDIEFPVWDALLHHQMRLKREYAASALHISAAYAKAGLAHQAQEYREKTRAHLRAARDLRTRAEELETDRDARYETQVAALEASIGRALDTTERKNVKMLFFDWRIDAFTPRH